MNKQEELTKQDNQQPEQQPVQEVKKRRDPNDRKIILCLIAIFFLIACPVVLTKILKEINKQKYENEIKMDNAFRGVVFDALYRNGIKDKISNIQLVTYTDNYPENSLLSQMRTTSLNLKRTSFAMYSIRDDAGSHCYDMGIFKSNRGK